MSFLSVYGLPSQKAYIRQYERDIDPFGNISPIHPLHPMRKMETIVVSSLREMEDLLLIGVDIPNLISDNGAFFYATEDSPDPKPEIDIRIAGNYNGMLRLATTTTIPAEIYQATNISEAIKGILTRRLDVIESQFWAQSFVVLGFLLSLPSAPQTFREIFALSKAFLARIVPTNSFDVLLSPRAFGAAVFENMLASSIVSSHTENQIASGSLNLVPFAGESWSIFEPVSVYPSIFPSVCRRYIYERYYDEVVVDENEDRNYRRITAERYFLPVIPRDYYYNQGEYFAAPIVTLRGNIAINNIGSYYSTDTLNNLNYVTSVI
jgi:hypothetical protein